MSSAQETARAIYILAKYSKKRAAEARSMATRVERIAHERFTAEAEACACRSACEHDSHQGFSWCSLATSDPQLIDTLKSMARQKDTCPDAETGMFGHSVAQWSNGSFYRTCSRDDPARAPEPPTVRRL